MLSPPVDEIAEEFHVQYSQDYWGDETPVYSSYGTKKPGELTSKSVMVHYSFSIY